MIHNDEELSIARERLQDLERRVEQIVSDPDKSRRAKEMELAGVRGMIFQIEQETRAYQLSSIQQSIHAIQNELESGESTELSVVVSKTLKILEEMTNVIDSPMTGVPQLDGSEV